MNADRVGVAFKRRRNGSGEPKVRQSKTYPLLWRDRPKRCQLRAVYQLGHVRQWYVYLARIAPDAITEIRANGL